MANRLINETSPYLLQHAQNPVDWYPWSDEALQRAREEDRPILVSIGYAACHWCHVMERESFEDRDTAAVMNELFINIKIDREERPDLDHIYMEAVQAIAGSGGWPLNVFLTPDGRPFYGGTYFPPRPLHNRASWTDVLKGVSEAFRTKREQIEAQAGSLTDHIRASNNFGIQKPDAATGGAIWSDAGLKEMFDNVMRTADTTQGGFGRAPKFPQTFTIRLLLHYYYHTRNETALNQALLSLDKMIMGGINDHLGGGFARYSTDEHWLAPHFEKMLYDNALIVIAMAEAYQVTALPHYENAIDATLAFVQREMTSPEGGFYAALDADSEGVEGKYYTWSASEIEAILGADAQTFKSYYNVTEHGNWEHTNILHVTEPMQVFAGNRSMTEGELQQILERGRQKLLDSRTKRVRPLTDDKILLGWNALMNAAYSKAYAATGNEAYRVAAVRNMDFLLSAFGDGEGGMYHTYKEGRAKYPAFLDDYALLIHALLHLQEITGNATYLEKVKTLVKWVNHHFSEPETGYFYFTNDRQKDIVVRKKEVYDGAVPSGNSLMAWNLYYSGVVFDDGGWRERAVLMCSGLKEVVAKYPGSFGIWAMLTLAMSKGVPEIAITGGGTEALLREVLQTFIPFRVIQSSPHETTGFPLLAGKPYTSGAAIWLCKDYSCQTPVNEVAALKRMLEEMKG